MQPPSQHSRINLTELKAQIIKGIGPERAEQYFYCLSRFLSLKLTKVEFDKLCLRLIGKENIQLHNQLINAVLRNALHGKAPPALSSHANVLFGVTNGSMSLPNGVLHPVPPKRSSVGISSRLNGVVNYASRHPGIEDDKVSLQNQNVYSQDLQKLMQHHQEAGVGSSLKNVSTGGLSFVNVKDQGKVIGSRCGKEVPNRHQVQAPLGISLCPASIGGARKALPLTSNLRHPTLHDIRGLLDTNMLRDRMHQVASAHGLEGVSMDCANLLNNGLDAYLKQLIKSCVEMVGARCRDGFRKSNLHINSFSKDNFVFSRNPFQLQNSRSPLDSIQEARHPFFISMMDFKVSMELNPHLLGEDWPLLLEKMCINGLED